MPIMHWLKRVAATGLAASVVVTGVQTGHTAGQSLAQFRARVDLIQIDVSVLDKSRRPVRELTAADFTVLENGVPQVVSAFSAVDLPDPEVRPAAWMRTSPSDVFANSVADARLVVVLVDERSTYAPAMRQLAHRAALAAVDEIGPRDLGAVVYMANTQDGAEFTNDRARLRAAVDRLQPATRPAASPISALTQVADAMAAVANRRKTLIYVGPGEPVSHNSLTASVTPGSNDPDLRSATQALEDAEIERQGTIFQRLRLLFQRTQAANVNLYLIDTAGLQSSAPTPRMGAPGTLSPIDIGRDSRDFMHIVAKETGGRAVTLNNAPERQVPAIFQENGSYYLLGFRSTNPRADGQLRKLEVKVNRTDVEVRARRSYVAPKPVTAGSVQATPLGSALQGLVPATDLRLALVATPFGSFAGPEAPIALSLRLPAAGASASGLAMLFNASNDRGQSVQSRRWTVPASARSAGAEATDVHARVDLPPGRYDFRVSAQDAASGAAGSVFASVEVPDVVKLPLTVSGIALEELPAKPGILVDDMPWFLPLRPTLNRAFAATATVAAFMRVYQGGATPAQPVTVDTTILDGRDAAVVRKSEPWDASKFSADRTAIYRAPLPLAGLSPGRYLFKVRVAVNPKQSVERAVPFEVR